MIALSSGLVALSIGAGIGLAASHSLVVGPRDGAALRVAELEQPAALPGAALTRVDHAPAALAAAESVPAIPQTAVLQAPVLQAPVLQTPVAPAPVFLDPDALHLAGWKDDNAAPTTSPRPLKRPDFVASRRVTATAIPRFEGIFGPVFTAPSVTAQPRVVYGRPSAAVARSPALLPGYLIGVYR